MIRRRDVRGGRRTWGPETVAVDLEGVLKATAEGADARTTALAASFGTGATATREPDDGAVRQAACVFTALEELAAGQRLDAVAVRCFDLVTRRGTSGCLALAEILARPLGNHLVLVPGLSAARLRDYRGWAVVT